LKLTVWSYEISRQIENPRNNELKNSLLQTLNPQSSTINC
jgi:hypothetical protein